MWFDSIKVAGCFVVLSLGFTTHSDSAENYMAKCNLLMGNKADFTYLNSEKVSLGGIDQNTRKFLKSIFFKNLNLKFPEYLCEDKKCLVTFYKKNLPQSSDKIFFAENLNECTILQEYCVSKNCIDGRIIVRSYRITWNKDNNFSLNSFMYSGKDSKFNIDDYLGTVSFVDDASRIVSRRRWSINQNQLLEIFENRKK